MIFHQPDNSVGNHSYNAVIYARGTDWEMHFHQNLELIYAISGNLHCNIGNKEEVLGTEDFALCLSNEIHSLHPDSDTVYWVGSFPKISSRNSLPLSRERWGRAAGFAVTGLCCLTFGRIC